MRRARRRWAPAFAALCVAAHAGCAAPVDGSDADSAVAESDASAGTPADPVALAAAAAAAAAAIDLDFLLDRIAVLAHDDFNGRDNGSPRGIAARDWLRVDLGNHGLSPLAAAGFDLPFDAGVARRSRGHSLPSRRCSASTTSARRSFRASRAASPPTPSSVTPSAPRCIPPTRAASPEIS